MVGLLYHLHIYVKISRLELFHASLIIPGIIFYTYIYVSSIEIATELEVYLNTILKARLVSNNTNYTIISSRTFTCTKQNAYKNN